MKKAATSHSIPVRTIHFIANCIAGTKWLCRGKSLIHQLTILSLLVMSPKLLLRSCLALGQINSHIPRDNNKINRGNISFEPIFLFPGE